MKNKFKVVLSLSLASLLAVVSVASSKSSGTPEKKIIILNKDNTLMLTDEVNGESVSEVIVKAKQLDNRGVLSKLGLNKDHIYLFLRTPGGSVQSGMEMFEALNGLTRKVDTITLFAASMGFQTAQQLGDRYILQNGVLMSHRAHGGFEGDFGGQKPSQIDSRKGIWEQRMLEMDQKTVERTKGKQTLASYQAQYASELWMTGSQATELGYADEVVQVRCDSSLAGVVTKSVNFMGLVNIEYDLDNCPLNTAPMNVRVGRILTNKGLLAWDKFVAKNGGFGSSCLVESGRNPSQVCAINTTLTFERVIQLKSQFSDYYMNIKDRTLPFGM